MFNEEGGSYKISLIQTDLECTPVGETDIYVSPDEEVTPEVITSSSSKISYQWYSEGYSTLTEGADSPSYSIASVTEKHGYSYLVKDQYGSESSVHFVVDILDYSDPQIIKDGGSREVSISEESPYVLFKFTPTISEDLPSPCSAESLFLSYRIKTLCKRQKTMLQIV